MARPRTPLLSRQLIRDTTLRMIDEHGLGDVSMRRIATELGVRAPSLYTHYPTKDALLDDIGNLIADDVDQAAEDLTRDWANERRQQWAIDTGTPCTDPRLAEQDLNVAPTMRAALRQARLTAERCAVEASVPPDVSVELADVTVTFVFRVSAKGAVIEWLP